MSDFLFGYGSLMNSASRAASGRTGAARFAEISGLRRGWFARSLRHGTTPVGVVPDESASCNGVLVEVGEGELGAFDHREVVATGGAYRRERIPPGRISGFRGDGTVWVYVANRIQHSIPEFPIVQTYIDVILAGCLEESEDFARRFIRTTTGWENHWLNDRARPVYVRPQRFNHLRERFDAMLREEVPAAFARRVDATDRS